MNKAVIIGIALSAVVIGILVVLSLDSFSIQEDDNLSSKPILENEEQNIPKPPGRNLSIELDEKMGLSAP